VKELTFFVCALNIDFEMLDTKGKNFLCHELELRVAPMFDSLTSAHEAWLNCKTNHVVDVREEKKKNVRGAREIVREISPHRWSS
jgi:hypothetical protein